jgi:hypothetical protein
MDIKYINFSTFVRYVLSGFNFILFVIVLPIIYFSPDLIRQLFSEASIIGVLFLSISIGYLLDILKIYRFTPNYNKTKIAFWNDIAKVLGVPIEEAPSYFAIATNLWDAYSTYNLERRASEWIHIFTSANILILSSSIWLGITIKEYLGSGLSNNLIIPIGAVLAFLLFGLRLLKVGRDEIDKDDKEFLLILKANKKKILTAWTIENKIHKMGKGE